MNANVEPAANALPFPFPEVREKQAKALDFVARAVSRDYRFIVVEAPTGLGKSAVGVAAASWAMSVPNDGTRAAYYLVTQKLLQQQIMRDFKSYRPPFFQAGRNLTSASEYRCDQHYNCAAGQRNKPICSAVREGNCAYLAAKDAFINSVMGVTNYAYFFTERTFVGKFPKRRVMVLDECHTVERQILNMVELSISEPQLEETVPSLVPMKRMDRAEDFLSWLEKAYLPRLREYVEALEAGSNHSVDEIRKLDRYSKLMSQLEVNTKLATQQPKNWVYEQRENEQHELVSSLRPISAVPFVKPLLWEAGNIHLFMSAYPGPKEVFCRSLGLDPAQVAWIKLGSPFAVENRPVYRFYQGSMSHKNQKESLPSLLQTCAHILDDYREHRGIIHCGSYRLGQIIFDYLHKAGYGSRLIFPRNADSREDGFAKHAARAATVLISPSMSEGYDFKDDLARFQIVAKVQWPYLMDAQVDAKRKLDPQWYDLQAVNFIIQAIGRGVRHENDWCMNFILDSDFGMLLDRCPEFFPRWFTDALRS